MKTIALLGAVLALSPGCKKKAAGDKSVPSATPIASAPPPVGRHKGITPRPMPPALTLTADEQAQVSAAAAKAQSGVVQYGVARGGYPEEEETLFRKNPKLLAKLAMSDKREVVVASVQELIDLQVSGQPQITLLPEWKPIVYAAMTSADTAIAASATQSASGGWHDEKADPDFQKMLEEICPDDTRPIVRAAACAGVVAHLNTSFPTNKSANAVAAQALTDEDNLVVLRTLDELDNELLDVAYQDKLLPLLASPEPAIRGLAAAVVDRNLNANGQQDMAATKKGYDALVPLLKDAEPFVRCKALYGLSGWNMKDHWDYVDGALALLDDTAEPKSKLAYKSEWLDGAKDAEWSVSASSETVGECALRSLISKAGNASADALKFEDWDNIKTTGRPAFEAWWKANGDKLKAPK